MRRKRPPAEVIPLRATPPDRLMDPLWLEDFPGGRRQADAERDEWLRENPHNSLTIDEYRDWLAQEAKLHQRPS